MITIREIELTQGKFAVVDDDMFDYLSQWKWHIRSGYASRNSKYVRGQKRSPILMHRVINNTPDGMYTDHINGDRLDNRKENLRTCTLHQNSMNVSKPKNRGLTSKYKGVMYNIEKNYWTMSVKYEGKSLTRTFKSELAAANYFNHVTSVIYGDFAKPNTVDTVLTVRECEDGMIGHQNTKYFYRGVVWRSSNQKWIARVNIKGVRTHLGTYTSIVDAALAYNQYLIEEGLLPTIEFVFGNDPMFNVIREVDIRDMSSIQITRYERQLQEYHHSMSQNKSTLNK